MPLFKNTVQLITEMSKSENSGLSPEKIDVKMTSIDFKALMKDMESISMGDLASTFTAESVAVRHINKLGYDLVEMDELAKYMTINGVRSFKEAISNIAEACCPGGRDPANFAVVVDESAIENAIAEAECVCAKGDIDEILRKAKVNDVVSTKKVLDILYHEGVNVVKRTD
jgi:hypothetical protein